MFVAAQFTIATCWKQATLMPISQWMDQKTVYIYAMEYYAAEGKKELLPFVTAWMGLESILLSEISQVVKDKYHMISPLSGA